MWSLWRSHKIVIVRDKNRLEANDCQHLHSHIDCPKTKWSSQILLYIVCCCKRRYDLEMFDFFDSPFGTRVRQKNKTSTIQLHFRHRPKRQFQSRALTMTFAQPDSQWLLFVYRPHIRYFKCTSLCNVYIYFMLMLTHCSARERNKYRCFEFEGYETLEEGACDGMILNT